MGNPMFSFTTDLNKCPKCDCPWDTEGSLTVGGHRCTIDEEGHVIEDEQAGTQLILANASPDVTCERCGLDVSTEFAYFDENL